MKSKKDLLIGRWETWDQDTSLVYEITRTKRGLRVKAFDKDDGEEFIVSKMKWDGRQLSFEVYVPSTKYRTKNSLRPVSETKLIQELTYWEPWKKVM